MRGLRELQRDFATAIAGEGNQDFHRCIRTTAGLSGARRLQVYRNNTALSLTGALEAVYPVVRRVVGAEFFRYAAAQYLISHPSRSGDLHDFGECVPSFLQSFEPVVGLTYLPDIARLEWAYHQVFHAASSPPLDCAALAQVPTERYGELRFQLHPATRLLQSNFPILRIWQANQDDAVGDAPLDLREGGVKLLIIRRPQLDIEFQPLGDGEFALLRALAAQYDFAAACERATAAQPAFELPACFSRHVLRGTLVSFHLPPLTTQ